MMAAEPDLRRSEHPTPDHGPSEGPPDLERLLPRIARGDGAAMAELYDGVCGRLFGICTRLLRDRHLAEDVVAELFGDVWRRADHFDPGRGTVLTWLATMARRRCIDKLRSRGVRRAREVDHGDDDLLSVEDHAEQSAPFELVARRDQASIVSAALGRLPDHQRRALELAFHDGLSHSEVARALDLPLGTIKSQIRRGLLLLEQLLPALEVEA